METEFSEHTASPSDDELARAALEDPQSFTLLYQRYVTRIYRYCLSRLSSPVDAEDCTAQVFLDAWHSLADYRPSGRFTAWLFTIAARRAADHHRRSEPPSISIESDLATEILAAPEQVDAASAVIAGETYQEVENLIQQQNSSDQELLRLRFSAELSHAEIARVVGRSPAAVKMALSRCLHRMQKEWEIEHEPED